MAGLSDPCPPLLLGSEKVPYREDRISNERYLHGGHGPGLALADNTSDLAIEDVVHFRDGRLSDEQSWVYAHRQGVQCIPEDNGSDSLEVLDQVSDPEPLYGVGFRIRDEGRKRDVIAGFIVDDVVPIPGTTNP